MIAIKRTFLRFAFVSFQLFSLFLCAAQSIVPPTPNAMKLTEYVAQRPNLYTGTANVSIPLYTIEFDGWQLPLSLSYNATGIRTNEEAGEVGLGWALNATGVISRTIRGGDDLFQGIGGASRKGYVYNDEAVRFATGYDWKTDPTPPDTSYYFKLATSGPDTEPDIFNYNFFGYSGSFVLTQKVATNNVIKVIKLTEGPVKITFDEAGQFFSVITPDGFRGDFTVREKSTSISSSTPGGTETHRMLCCSEGNVDIVAFQNTSGRFRTTTTWYLSKIVSPRGREIEFNYDLNQNGSSPYLSNSKSFAELVGINSPQVCIQTIHEHVYLKNIISDEVNVEFTMEDREDLRENTFFTTGTSAPFPLTLPLKRFSEIHITGRHPASTFDKTIVFRQGYFNQQFDDGFSNNFSEAEFQWLRSRLESVRIDEQEYQFYYDQGAGGIPNKLTTGIDHFGFYNGHDDLQLLLPPGPVSSFEGYVEIQDTAIVEYYKQGVDRMVAFNYGKAGLLSKVRYPTRGYTTFEYEPHSYVPDHSGYFREEGVENNAGGARIAAIKDFDFNNSMERSKSYIYRDTPLPGAATTGRLMTALYNRYAQIQHDPSPPHAASGATFIHSTHSTIPGNNSAEGKVIGYSKVHEIVHGLDESYRNTYYFENRRNVVLPFNAIAVGYPNLNGEVIERRNYDSDGKIVQQTVNKSYFHPLDSIKAITYQQGSGTFLRYLIPYTLRRTFNTPDTIITITASLPSGIIENGEGKIVTWGTTIETKQSFSYSNNYQLKTERTINSVGEELIKEYKRPGDFTNLHPVHDFMLDMNIVSPIVEEVITRNGTVISAIGNRFEIQDSIVNLTANFIYNRGLGSFAGSSDGYTFQTPFELRTQYTKYDNATGKLLEYTGPDGVTNSFIWGYDGTLPIVHGLGVSHQQLSQAYSATSGSPNYESAIRSHSNLAGKQVTTFIHDPLVGVTRVTDPSGRSKTYQYDQYNRLEKVKDHESYTVEQYDYHFKERAPTRILSVAGSLNFGTLTPDFFTPTSLPYDKCSDGLDSLAIVMKNTGEEDLTIQSITPPAGFDIQWKHGVIPAGTGIINRVIFTARTAGTYSGNVVITSDKTAGPSEIPISATYAERICDFAVSSPLIDFGIVTGSYTNQYLTVTNNGNATLRLVAAPLDWDGTPAGTGDYSQYSHPDFSIGLNTNCINPGQSVSLQISYHPQANGQSITHLSLIPDQCDAEPDIVTIKGDKRSLGWTSKIVLDPSPLTIPAFTTETTTATITVKNEGNWELDVEDVSSSNPNFTVTPSQFTVPPNNGTTQVTLTYDPGAYNFSQQTTTLTFHGDQTSGTNTITVTGQRTRVSTIELLTDELVFDPPLFTYQYVTVRNNGNDLATIQGASYPNTTDWSATIDNTPLTLAPGQTTNLKIMQLTPADYDLERLDIKVAYNNTVSTDFVTVDANKRIITLIPSSTAIPSFTGSSNTKQVTVRNDGNTALSVTSVTSSNSRFSASPGSFTIQPGLEQTVTITYVPTDFSSQSSTITFNSNRTGGGNTLSISGQRTMSYSLYTYPLSLVIKPSTQILSSTITNNGNVNATINSVSNSNTSAFTISVRRYLSGTWVVTSLPYTLTPGQQLNIELKSANGSFSSATGYITVTPNQGSSFQINIARSPTP